MWRQPRANAPRVWRSVARLVLLGLAGGGFTWAWSELRKEDEVEQLSILAQRITAGESIEAREIDGAAPLIATLRNKGCADRALVAAAITTIYAASRSAAHIAEEAPERRRAALETTRQALACAPHRAVLWYGLFWLERSEGAMPSQYLLALELSYRLARNETWLAVHRLGDALPHYAQLPPATQSLMRSEFRNLTIASPAAVALTLAEADEADRNRLLAWISEESVPTRERVARMLDLRGAIIDIPGVVYLGGRVVSDPSRKR